MKSSINDVLKKEKYTILCPNMSPIHLELVEGMFQKMGYNFVLLPTLDKDAIELGLKYVNNDMCYPAIIVIGQLLKHLMSGEYNLEKTAVLLPQTGGQCRATNYIAVLKKALDDSNISVPIISLSPGYKSENNLHLDLKILIQSVYSILLGDLLSQFSCRCRPYEKNTGEVDSLVIKWQSKIIECFPNMRYKDYITITRKMLNEFETVPLNNIEKPKVGIVGELFVKYSPLANNNLLNFLEQNGMEVVPPSLSQFFFYCLSNYIWDEKKDLGKQNLFKNKLLKPHQIAQVLIKILKLATLETKLELDKSSRFHSNMDIFEIAKKTEKIISLNFHAGEGWFLSGEIVEYLESGVPNIVCVQPFGCLANHVAGRGTQKEIRRLYPDLNFCAIDYDYGASEINQVNRLLLMIENAKSYNSREKGKTFIKSNIFN